MIICSFFMQTKMKKVLIANRGEIALRIMRSVKEMGLQNVAVYSEADKNAPFVRFADEAFLLGPPPSSQSYLLGDKIIKIALECGADAIHPGYGFLSENADFARKVDKAGLVLIGPSPHAMEIMGSKLAAKAAVSTYNIPMVPGTDKAITDIPKAKELAMEIGYPILIKASAGGGGKGMRIVEKPEDFIENMDRAISEAESAFGDGSVFIERYVASPRHVEIQIMADTHGNIVYLNERECSIQRRHQKVIEEAPCAIVTPEIRKRMGEDAVNVARACNYVGAGTVEFLMDEDKNYYFLEMNTRLQVEHPVTEMTTGIDLVKEQIRVARGERLSFTQHDIGINGHAIEVRVYAEDPQRDFLPDIGKLVRYRIPVGEGIRVDDGFEEGDEIPIYYDPMISKLIVHAPTRQEAIDKMIEAIDHYEISGVSTILPFCKYALNHESFRSGHFNTHFVRDFFQDPDVLKSSQDEKEIAAIIGAIYNHELNGDSEEVSSNTANNKSMWYMRRI
jgi:acetyl-CoA carboxylase biotin carboxylase subunit